MSTQSTDYNNMSDSELLAELEKLRNPSLNAYNIGDAKERNMAAQQAIISILQSKNIAIPPAPSAYTTPTYANTQSSQYQEEEEEGGGVNTGKVVLGVVLLLLGIGITMASSGSIFYGLMIVGGIMIVQGFMGN
jgi:hypothetical protein